MRHVAGARLVLLASLLVLGGCPYQDYPSMPHRSVAYGPGDGPLRCDSCHRGEPGSASLDQQACLSCHAPVAQQLKQRIGFHGLRVDPGARCAQCHHEHRGPTWPDRLVDFPTEQQALLRPEHGRVAGFALTGGHAPLACERCHAPRRTDARPTFLGLSSACSACHRERSPHGPVKEPLAACELCHDTSAFRPAQPQRGFDHGRDTTYPLRGAHATTDCAACHRTGPASGAAPTKSEPLVFALPPERSRDCQPCHEGRSPHGGSFGPRLCKSCHAPERGWRPRSFNHRDETHFALDGRHAEQACKACHRASLAELPAAPCEGCHGERSPHGARFQAQGGCDTCHGTADWQDNKFAHGDSTGFPLSNLHTASSLAACTKCHRRTGPGRHGFESLASLSKRPVRGDTPGGGLRAIDCRGCHVHGQQHADSQTAAQRTRPCLSCHAEPGSTRLIRLLAQPIAKITEPADTERVSWFGHGPERPFRLSGGHALARVKTCRACHAEPRRGFSKLQAACASCHAKSDAHRGSLGDCGRCHDPSTAQWPVVPRFSHDRAFKLEGSHSDTRCASCHPSGDPATQYRGRPTQCGAPECHERSDTLHRGSHGRTCGSSDCHSPLHRGWRIPKFHPTARPPQAAPRSGGNP